MSYRVGGLLRFSLAWLLPCFVLVFGSYPVGRCPGKYGVPAIALSPFRAALDTPARLYSLAPSALP